MARVEVSRHILRSNAEAKAMAYSAARTALATAAKKRHGHGMGQELNRSVSEAF